MSEIRDQIAFITLNRPEQAEQLYPGDGVAVAKTGWTNVRACMRSGPSI